jgi:predicted dehydrogenase
MIRIGIIGFGLMGKIRFKCLTQISNCVVRKIYDTNFSDIPIGLKVDSFSDIINDPNIDVVFICTPNKYNFLYTKDSLLNGKHVFCEKPPAFTSDEVAELQKIEISSGLKLMYGFNHRHHQSIIQMKNLISSGEYGEIIWMRGRYGKSVDENFFNNWRADADLVGGGILFDQGIHMLDLFLYLVDDLEVHSALATNYFWKQNLEDNVFVNLKSKSKNIVASLHSTMTQWRHLFSLEIFLEKGYITLNGLITSSMSYGKETLTVAKNRTIAPRASWNDEESITFDEDDFWQSEVDYFMSNVSKNTNIDFCNSTDAYRVIRLIEDAYLKGKEFIK